MRADAIIIGAGLGGLSAAIALAARGLDVLVLELGAHPGGKAGRATVDGVTFDTGPSLLTMPQVLAHVAEQVGGEASDIATLRRLDPAFHYRWQDDTHLDVFHDPDDTLTSVRTSLGDDAGDDLRNFLTYARRIWDAAAPTFVYGDAPTASRLLRTDVRTLARMRHVDPLRTMGAAIRARVRSPHLRMLLERYATYNGSDVRRAPATLNCIAAVELVDGGWGIEGGVHAMVDGLERMARRAGATFEYGARVASIDVDGAGVRGVTLADGRVIRASRVVANADAAHVLGDLLPERRRRSAGFDPSTSGVTAVFRRSRSAGPMPAPHVVLFPSDYDAEFVDLFDRGRVPADPTVYACCQTAAHGIGGWDDATPLFAMVNAPATRDAASTDTNAAVETMRRALVAAGILRADDTAVWARGPQELADRFPGSFGGIYGAASNSPMAAFARPANAIPQVPGLFLASGSAHPGGGMPLCLLSGLAAARQAVARSAVTPASPSRARR